jgi:DNA-binding NtrC family response regulator
MAQPCNAIHVVVVDDDVAFRTAHVVLTDYQMASIDGLKFADAVHDIRPETTIVLTTAYWTVEIETAVALRPFVQLCRKPVDYDELHELVHQLAR